MRTSRISGVPVAACARKHSSCPGWMLQAEVSMATTRTPVTWRMPALFLR
jgi:hypothetical protein